MDMSDYKESHEGYQIIENDEQRVTDDIEVFKLGKLGSNKNDDNIEKEYDEINQMDISDDNKSDERDHIDKNDD